MPLEALVERLAEMMEVDPQHLQQRTKKKRITEARNVISYVAVRCRGYNGAMEPNSRGTSMSPGLP
jgi:predicted Co/Zn/Cd cation transporter (cation efflux family)